MGQFSDIHAAQANPGSSARRKEREQERQREQQQQQAEAVEQQVQAVEEMAEQAPESVEQAAEKEDNRTPDPGLFEEWLAEQADRDDATGRLAKFVLDDIADTCWRHSVTSPGYTDLYYENAWVERVRKYAAEHLMVRHDAGPEHIAVLNAAWEEYLAARWEFVTRFLRVRTAAERPADFA